MLCKLAFRNVRRSVKDYFIYFLTLTFGVCLFYTFNSLGTQQVMQFLDQTQHYMVEAIMVWMKVLSAFVAVVLAGLILYANTFLLRRRKKELGTYLLLGMPLSQVSLILVLETLFIGLLALASGLALGVLAAHGLSALTMAMFRMTFEPLRFVFDPSAALFTAACFGGMFLLVMVFNQVTLSRQKLIDLMNAGRKNEELRQRPLGVSVALFLAGVLLLIIAYALLLIRGMLVIDFLFLVMLILGTLGTLLFFRGLSGFVLRLCQSRPKFYYKGLNMFVLRQWSGRIHSSYLSMTVICILLLLAIGATACSVGLNAAIEDSTDGTAPFDVTIQNYSGDTTVADLPALLKENGFDCDTMFASRMDYLLYYNDVSVTGVSEFDAYAALRWSDYNALLAFQGEPALEPITTGTLVDHAIFTDNYGASAWAVIPDEMAEELSVRRQVFVADYAGDKETAETAFQAAMDGLYHIEGLTLNVSTSLQIYVENMGSKILVLFIGLYLGIVFLLASAAVLALQQLSQAADNVNRYRTLARLGVEERQRSRSVFAQVALAFGLPLALAIVHAVVGMKAANDVILQVGRVDTVYSSAVTAGVLVLIYGAYFLATCWGSKSIVRAGQ
ncbi:MAG: FtsX-like permease family protein [Oscillospiraceae bacterium]